MSQKNFVWYFVFFTELNNQYILLTDLFSYLFIKDLKVSVESVDSLCVDYKNLHPSVVWNNLKVSK